MKSRQYRKIEQRRAMTLIEVLAVVVILGLIATTLTLSFRGQMGTAKRELARTGIGVLVNAVETFSIETGKIPSLEEGLRILTEPGSGRSEGLIKEKNLFDPWGNPYQYITPGPSSSYQVISYGADGQLGGAPDTEAQDITSDDLGSATGGRSR